MRNLWNSAVYYSPEGTNGFGGAGAPPQNDSSLDNVDLGPVPDQGQATGYSYIDDAYNNMLADDMPEGTQQQPQPRSAPQYPQPVVPPQQRQQQQPAAPQRQVQQQPAQPQQTQQQSAAPAAPAALQAPTAEQRMRSDPFEYQAELMEQQQEQFIQALAQRVYAISPEDMDAFLSGDATKVSQALARVHVNSVGSVMKVVSQYMPMWVGNMLKAHQTATEREGAFWSANPHLNREAHRELANAAARAFRQMNPNADAATMNKMVGAMVAAAAGVQAPATQQFGRMPGTQVRTPGPVVRRTGAAATPSGVQNLSTGQRSVVDDNPWGQMTDIIQADESGVFDHHQM